MSDTPRAAARTEGAAAVPRAMVYVRDQESERILRQVLSDLGAEDATFTNGGIEAAISGLSRQESPRLLVVDISGTPDPVARVNDLAQLCEPTTGVVVIGDINDVVLYRNLKNEGVVEYYFKPLVSSLVSGTCSFILTGAGERPARTGKLIVVMGVRGGVGATGLATAAAWHLAEMRHRHVLLMDLDLLAGDMALQLDVIPNHTLCEALQKPERVDEMFLERGVIHVTPRLDLLASLEPLDPSSTFEESAVLKLMGNLLNRYRYVFLDLPLSLAPQLPGLMQLAGVCILVSESSLVAARDVARWRQKIGPSTAERLMLHVVNKAGAHGSLPVEEFVRAVGHAPDLVIQYDREISEESMRGAKGLTKQGALIRAFAPVLRRITGETIEESQSLFSRMFG